MQKTMMLVCGATLLASGAAAWALAQAGGQKPNPVREVVERPRAVASPSASADPSPLGAAHRKGDAYPDPVTVNLRDTFLRSGAKEALGLVELSGKSPNTVIAFVRCRGGQGARPVKDITQVVIFRPGDPLRRTVSCPVLSADAGDFITFNQAHEPDGAKRGVVQGVARVSDRDPTTTPITNGFRLPYAFTPQGGLVYSADASSLLYNDRGGPGTWSTSLSHGRSQPANNETGYYGTVKMGSVQVRNNQIVLHTERLAQPVDAKDGRPSYPFLAAVLSAHNARDLEFMSGSVEWDVRMPDRKGAWPALWLLPRHGWPPEIDVYEGFSHNPEWNLPSSLSSTLHGGRNNKRTFQRSAFRMQMSDFGLPNTLTSEFHKFQVTVNPNWITMFVDGVETTRFANPFPGTQWHPLMQVAVKAPADSTFDQGSGDMVVRSVKIWRAQ